MSSISCQEGFTKGFLYKIKDDKYQTRGYLFGTIHELDSENLSNLHPKIFKSINKCKSLFVEMYIGSEFGLKEHEKMLSYYNIPENLICDAIEAIKIEGMSIDGMDDILIDYANKNKIPIHNLETAESKIEAKKKVEEDREDLRLRQLGALCIAIQMASLKITNFYASTKPSDPPEIWFEMYMDAYNALLDTIKILHDCHKCKVDKNKLQLPERVLHDLKRKHTFVLMMLGDKGTELQENMLTFRGISQEELAEYEESSKKKNEAYIQGDKEKYLDRKKSLTDEKIEEIQKKEAFFRDQFMLGRILESLEKPNKADRHFYAFGCAHLLAKYDNLYKQLEKNGWKIINAYEAS